MTAIEIPNATDEAAHVIFNATLQVTREPEYGGYRCEVDNGWKRAFVVTNADMSDVTVFQWTYAGGAGGLAIFKHPTIADAVAQLRTLLDLE